MLKILIVEDNPTFRQSLKEIFSERFPSVLVEEAADGKEALEKVEGFSPHLVFMDIRLPGENGLAVTRKIKARYPSVIIIILTSYDSPEYREAADHHGADHFLSKGSASREEIVRFVSPISSRSNPDWDGPDRIGKS